MDFNASYDRVVQANLAMINQYNTMSKTQTNLALCVSLATGKLIIMSRKTAEANPNWKCVKIEAGAQRTDLQLEVPEEASKMNNVAQTIFELTKERLKPAKRQEPAQHTPLILTAGKPFLHDEVVQLAVDCFGRKANAVLSLDHPPHLQASLLFGLARERLESPVPVTEVEIKKIYTLLFTPPIKDYAEQNLQDDYHPCVVFANLNDAVMAWESKGAAWALEPTGGISEQSAKKFSGVNGSYYFKGTDGSPLWVFKPVDEDKGPSTLKGFSTGDAIVREHVACVLNYHRQYPIPYTALISLGGRVGSAQAFMPGCKGLDRLEYNPLSSPYLHKMSLKGVQGSLHFDIRCNNWDRNSGNLLVKVREIIPGVFEPTSEIFAIDNGFSMQLDLHEPMRIEQMTQVQCREDMDADLKEMTKSLDIYKDQSILLQHGIDEAAIQRMTNATIFLKIAVGYSLESKQQNLPEITLFDLGMVALRDGEVMWLKNPREQFHAYCKQIIDLKMQVQELYSSNPGLEVKDLFLLRQKFAAQYPPPGKKMLQCMFGTDPHVISEFAIDIQDSLAGMYLRHLKQKADGKIV